MKASIKAKISVATELKRWKFALGLPFVNVDSLPKDMRTCSLCNLPYNPEFEVSSKKLLGHETAVILPCDHIFGFHCIRDYLSPHECAFTSCPTCGFEFSEMADESEIILPTATDFSWLKIADHTQQDIEKKEEKNEISTSQLAINSDASHAESSQYPSIGEVLDASSSKAITDLVLHYEKPLIIVTDPEGGSDVSQEAEAGKHISNADTLDSFSRGNDQGPTEEEKQAAKSKSKAWALALGVVKAAELLSMRSGI